MLNIDVSFEEFEDFSYEDYKLCAISIWRKFKDWESKNNAELIEFYNFFFRNIDSISSFSYKKIQTKFIFNIASIFIDRKSAKFLYESFKMVDDHEMLNIYINLRELGKYKLDDNSFDCFPDLTKKMAIEELLGNKNIVSLALRWAIDKQNFEGDLYGGLHKFINNNDFRIKLKKLVLKFFYEANLDIKDNTIDEAFSFLTKNFTRLLDVLPDEVLLQSGFAKMVKVLLGMIAHSAISIPSGSSCEEINNILLKSVKLGYYWGVTYPLLDDVIDSNVLSKKELTLLKEIVHNIFSKESISVDENLFTKPYLNELIFCLFSLREVMPYNEHKLTYKLMQMAHHAQNEDSELSLCNSYNEETLYSLIILKAALVRIATASISGVKIDSNFIKNIFIMALYNQEEDDFQDFFEDIAARRPTPFTFYIRNRLIENPITIFFSYSSFIISLSENDIVVKKVIVGQLLEIFKNLISKKGSSLFSDDFMKIFIES